MPILRRIGVASTTASLVIGGLLAPAAGAAPASRAGALVQAPAVSPTSSFGASINTPDDVNRLSTLMGRPLTSARVFLGGTPTQWSNSKLLATVPANGTVAVSFQSGTPAQVQTFLSGHPSTMTCYATYFHEPEDNFTSAAQKAAYRASWDLYAPAIRAANCKPTLILMKWSLNPKSGRDWHDWFPVGDVDVLAFDAYNAMAKKGTYGDAARYLAPIIAAQAETHLPWALTELGSDVPAGTASTDRADWAHRVAVAAAADPNFLFADWWDVLSKDGSRDYRLDSNAALAWNP